MQKYNFNFQYIDYLLKFNTINKIKMFLKLFLRS